MKVQLLVSRAGPGFVQSAGEEVEVSDSEGKWLINANEAIPVVTKVKPETRDVESSAGNNKAKRVPRNAGRGKAAAKD